MPVKVNWLQLLREKCLEDRAEIITVNEKNINGFDKINREMRCQFLCHCGEKGDKVVRQIIQVSGVFCKKCTLNMSKDKVRKTNMEKYGVANGHCFEVQEKIKETNLKKFGVENSFQSESIKDKIKQNNLEKYGTEFPQKLESTKYKIRLTNKHKYGVECSFLNKDVKDKIKQTTLERFGVEHNSRSQEIKERKIKTSLKNYGTEFPTQSKMIKQRTKNTCIEKFGVPYALQSECVKEKGKETCLKKYGVQYSLQSDIVREKGKETCLKKYGVEHPMQNKDFFDTHQKLSFKRKNYTFITGETDTCQGYEHWSLRELEEHYGYSFNDYQNWNGLEFWYEYLSKKHRYYPDIPFLRENLIIEVKSDYTFYKEIKRNLLKAKSVIEKGINFEFWIYHNNGNKNILSNKLISSKLKINDEIKNLIQ